MFTKKNINLLTIVILGFFFMVVGGLFYDMNTNRKDDYFNFMYWPLAIGFGSAGGTLMMSLIKKNFLPDEIHNEMVVINNH